MFALRRTVIAEGVKFVGSVTAQGLVQVGGQIEGDLQCARLIISRKAHIVGAIEAGHLVVDGKVEGPINGGNVILKSQAHVVGNIKCQTLTVDKGARVEGRLDFAADKCEPHKIITFNRDLVRQQEEMELVAAAEVSTRLAELVIEARHQTGNPNFATKEALAFLTERGNDEAKVFLDALQDS
jgi:cytoskeletal protein CcmA (bactofilin family)